MGTENEDTPTEPRDEDVTTPPSDDEAPYTPRVFAFEPPQGAGAAGPEDASGTTASGTTAPETAAPETAESETTAPETTAPVAEVSAEPEVRAEPEPEPEAGVAEGAGADAAPTGAAAAEESEPTETATAAPAPAPTGPAGTTVPAAADQPERAAADPDAPAAADQAEPDVESTAVMEAIPAHGESPSTGDVLPAATPVAVPPTENRPRPSSEPRRFGGRPTGTAGSDSVGSDSVGSGSAGSDATGTASAEAGAAGTAAAATAAAATGDDAGTAAAAAAGAAAAADAGEPGAGATQPIAQDAARTPAGAEPWAPRPPITTVPVAGRAADTAQMPPVPGAPSGTAPSGAASSGTAPTGTATSGTAPSGAASTGTSGTGTSGTGTSGTGVTGTTAAAAAYAELRARAASQPATDASSGAGADGGDDVLQGVGSDAAPSRWPKVVLWSGVGVVVLLGLYVGAQWSFADKVPSGTTVAGVDVGGMSHDDAADAIDAGLAPSAKEPVEVTAGEGTTSIDPVAAGLTVDGTATADTLTGFSLSPARLWQHLFGGTDVAPVVDADATALDAAVTTAAQSLDVAPVGGTVSFDGVEPTSTDAVDGTAVVVDEAATAIEEGWLVTDGPIDLPTTASEPEITQGETDAALEEATTVVSGPVTVSVGDQSVELPAEALAGAASYVPTDGDLVLTWDGDALVDGIIDRTNDLLADPEDAHFEFVGGRPTVVGGAEGTTLDPDDVAKSVGAAAVTDERAATVELVTTDPENSAEALEALGVKEKIVDFSTPITNEPVRTQNLVVGSQKVTGTLVKPGETFSILDTLSPITKENGYGDAHIVSDGLVVDGTGGGLSQMATNTYNIGFFAGYESVAYKPHSYWYDRYPEGRESTMFVPSIDMKWTNDTPYGVVLQAWVADGRLHTVAWSTKYWDVTSSTGERRNVVKTTTQKSDSSSCVASPAGNDGFTVTVYRKVSHDGTVDKDEARTWTYKPQNAIACE
ncbi:putative peptidoglycan binding protein [Sediminihabitans luteus]|uniref:Putative peptidoglycan binding protein n=1 Tax=Sediminihabitans luteus TaxID=1138585 RepID=A0A2M9CYN1_9CELL|nr:VanW family protein [Sediminihabitans luteus]PJJ77010.1 putative peptidoglycan binding protein [Sediminihabitans luteus]GII99652.1 hypothetical protein Slu03_20300 [Sediminihabitans luteus]